MKDKKITLWVIIILLIVFLPMTIFSTIMHFKNTNLPEENPEHAFKFDGKLYFYDEEKLLGTYTCSNVLEHCDLAVSSVNATTSLEEYEEAEKSTLPVIANRFVFLTDSSKNEGKNSPILLYDLETNRVIGRYKSVKNYGIGIENDYYILESEDELWGVVSFENGIVVLLPFQYDYIGLANHINSETNKIESNLFAVKNNDNWQLMDVNGASFTDPISENLVSYNYEYIIEEENGVMKLMNYYNQTILQNYKYLHFYNKYIAVIDIFSQFYLYDVNSKERITDMYFVESIEDIELVTNEEGIQIFRNGNLEETVEI